MRILITDKIGAEGIEILKKYATVDLKEGLSEDEIVEIIKDYDVLVVRSATKVTEKIINASNLKVIARAGIGLDNIDVNAATKKSVKVINAPLGNTQAAAELTFAMILALARRLCEANNSLKANKWEKKKLKGSELANKTLGVIGFGRVGKKVSSFAKAFGMNVIANDPYVDSELAGKLGVKLISLEELLKESDYITLHVPLTDATRNMIDKPEFEKMKPGVRIINCARGGVINEQALHEAILAGKVTGAALDVFVEEPPHNCPLLKLDQVIVTPHLGASTKEAQVKVGKEIAENIIKALGLKESK